MNNYTDYYSTMLARKLFQQGQEKQAAENNLRVPVTIEDIIPEEETQADPSQYKVFHNPGCGYENGLEPLQHPADFLRRWRAFYRLDPEQLPQHRNIQTLLARKDELYRVQAGLHAPRLATLTISLAVATLLSWQENYALLAVLALFPLVVWHKTNAQIEAHQRHILRNQAWIDQQKSLIQTMEKDIRAQQPTADVLELQTHYTLTLENFLSESIYEFFPSIEQAELAAKIHNGEAHLFVLESRGILQIPNVCQHSADNFATLEALIHHTGKSLCALQPFPELEGMTRLHYVYGVLCFEQGVLLCTGFYDWVGNQLHGTQREFHAYRNITHIHHTETRFPEGNVLHQEIPDEVYRQHFSQPVQVVSLGIKNGDQHCCTLPKLQVARKTYLTKMPNTFFTRHLKRDIRELVSTLTKALPGKKITPGQM